MRLFLLILVVSVSHCFSQSLPVEEGIILDLNADEEITIEEGNRVIKWTNQVAFKAKDFVSRDEGRKVPGSGRPTLLVKNAEIGGHNSVQFLGQELVNHDEDAFDHLITGNGYTWMVVMKAYKQVTGLKDVNSFIGNLRNEGKYEGFWGNLTDDNRLWMGSRSGVTFGRWDVNNPMILAEDSIKTNQFYLVSGRMGAGKDTVLLELFNRTDLLASGPYPVNTKSNSSKLAIGQERDAIQHPGRESFDGEIARVLIYERPLSDKELKEMSQYLTDYYDLKN